MFVNDFEMIEEMFVKHFEMIEEMFVVGSKLQLLGWLVCFTEQVIGHGERLIDWVPTSPVATGGFCGLNSPKQSSKFVNFGISTPLHEWKPPLLKTFWQRFWFRQLLCFCWWTCNRSRVVSTFHTVECSYHVKPVLARSWPVVPRPNARCQFLTLHLWLQMHQQGILRTDELITRFFRLCTEMCVDLTYRLLTVS